MKCRLCPALSAIMLAGSLSGCSGGTNGLSGDTSKASEAPVSEEAEGIKEESAAGKAGEKPYAGATIRILSMTGQILDVTEAYLNGSEEEAGIRMNLELYGEAQPRKKIATEFLTGSSTIDTFLVSPSQDMAAYNSNGWIKPLDEYLKNPDFDWDDFSSVPMKQIKIKSGGTIGALPLHSSVQLVFYRKDIFKEKGVKIPTSCDELLDVCGKVNDPTNNFYTVACRGEKIALTSQFLPFLHGFSGAYFKDGTCALSTPENLEATRFHGKLLGDYAPEGILATGCLQMTRLFNAGQVGMCVDAIVLYRTLIDPNESSFCDRVGVVPVPEGPTGRQSYKQVVWGVSIYSGPKNKKTAWEFLKYTADRDIAADIIPKGVPTFRASVWEDGRVTATMPEDYIRTCNEEVQADTTNQYRFPRMTAVSGTRNTMGEAIVYSIETEGEGADLESKMNVAAEKVGQLLRDAREYGADYPYEGQSMPRSNGGNL